MGDLGQPYIAQLANMKEYYHQAYAASDNGPLYDFVRCPNWRQLITGLQVK